LELKLIEKDYPEMAIFVELDEDAKKVWKKYKEIKTNKKLKSYERKNEFLKIKKEFYDYVISVSMFEEYNKEYKCELWDENLNIGYISNKDLDNYYDLQIGFKKNGTGSNCICF